MDDDLLEKYRTLQESIDSGYESELARLEKFREAQAKDLAEIYGKTPEDFYSRLEEEIAPQAQQIEERHKELSRASNFMYFAELKGVVTEVPMFAFGEQLHDENGNQMTRLTVKKMAMDWNLESLSPISSR